MTKPKFSFTDLHTKILGNFAGINPSILIEPDKIGTKNEANSVVALYEFETPFNFDAWGIYDLQNFLTVHGALIKPEIEVNDKFINIIGANNDKVKYFTGVQTIIDPIPDMVSLFSNLDIVQEFQLTADKLAIINKMSGHLKAKFIWFETRDKEVVITVGDKLESSDTIYEVPIDDGIKVNSLVDPISIPIIDFKILPGEYEVAIGKKVTPKGKIVHMTRWTNLNNVVYYIAVAK